MAEHPIPPKFRKFAEHLQRSLWPSVKWPQLIMLLEDDLGDQGDMLYQLGGATARLRLARNRIFSDFVDTASTIAHELTHLWVDLIHGSVRDGHGSEWRAEMERIGLPVPENSTRENVKRGGLFWQALQEFLALELAPELAPAAAADAALAAGMDSTIVNGQGVTPAIRARSEEANRALSPGRSTTAAPSSGGSIWGAATSAFSRQPAAAASPHSSMTGYNISGSEAAIVEGPRAASSEFNLIYADCSQSMVMSRINGKTLFEIQRAALREMVKNLQGRHKLYGYAANNWEVPTPDQLVCDPPGQEDTYEGIISGTSFRDVFRWASYFDRDNPDKKNAHIHLFSDGEPQMETFEWIMDERSMTSGDISTYYFGSPKNQRAIRIMKALARGNGKFHQISSEDELISAVRQEVGAASMPFTVPANFAPREQRDWEPERHAAVDHARQLITNQAHILDISTSLSEVEHGLGEVRQEVEFLRFNNEVTRQIVGHANQALGVIQGQREVDRSQRAITAEQNSAWMEGAGSEISRQSGEIFGGALLQAGQTVANSAGRQPRRMTLTAIDEGMISRATALMAGRGVQALPPPQASRAPQLPPSGQEPQANVWGAPVPEATGRRQLVPVKRG